MATTGEKVWIKKAVDETEVRKELTAVFQEGFRSLAIVLCHSYAFPGHEEQIAAIAQAVGFTQVTTSHSIMPMIKMVPRGTTTVVDSYLTPSITTYVTNFLSGFSDKETLKPKLLFMRSDGGLTPVNSFFGSRAVLSGPAGGVLGYAAATYDRLSPKRACIGFDMGGTSTDVSRWDGQSEVIYEGRAAGVQLQVPRLDIQDRLRQVALTIIFPTSKI